MQEYKFIPASSFHIQASKFFVIHPFVFTLEQSIDHTHVFKIYNMKAKKIFEMKNVCDIDQNKERIIVYISNEVIVLLIKENSVKKEKVINNENNAIKKIGFIRSYVIIKYLDNLVIKKMNDDIVESGSVIEDVIDFYISDNVILLEKDDALYKFDFEDMMDNNDDKNSTNDSSKNVNTADCKSNVLQTKIINNVDQRLLKKMSKPSFVIKKAELEYYTLVNDSLLYIKKDKIYINNKNNDTKELENELYNDKESCKYLSGCIDDLIVIGNNKTEFFIYMVDGKIEELNAKYALKLEMGDFFECLFAQEIRTCENYVYLRNENGINSFSNRKEKEIEEVDEEIEIEKSNDITIISSEDLEPENTREIQSNLESEIKKESENSREIENNKESTIKKKSGTKTEFDNDKESEINKESENTQETITKTVSVESENIKNNAQNETKVDFMENNGIKNLINESKDEKVSEDENEVKNIIKNYKNEEKSIKNNRKINNEVKIDKTEDVIQILDSIKMTKDQEISSQIEKNNIKIVSPYKSEFEKLKFEIENETLLFIEKFKSLKINEIGTKNYSISNNGMINNMLQKIYKNIQELENNDLEKEMDSILNRIEMFVKGMKSDVYKEDMKYFDFFIRNHKKGDFFVATKFNSEIVKEIEYLKIENSNKKIYEEFEESFVKMNIKEEENISKNNMNIGIQEKDNANSKKIHNIINTNYKTKNSSVFEDVRDNKSDEEIKSNGTMQKEKTEIHTNTNNLTSSTSIQPETNILQKNSNPFSSQPSTNSFSSQPSTTTNPFSLQPSTTTNPFNLQSNTATNPFSLQPSTSHFTIHTSKTSANTQTDTNTESKKSSGSSLSRFANNLNKWSKM